MARNASRRFRREPTDCARWRAGADSPADAAADAAADSWRALANVTVASALVAAVVVSGLSLCESLLSNPASRLARRSPESPVSHVPAQYPFEVSNSATQCEPVLFVTD